MNTKRLSSKAGLFCLLLVLAGCSSKPVLIERTAAQVKEIVDEGAREGDDYAAHTDWFFHCQPTFAYAVAAVRQTDTNVYQADVFIKQVQLKVSLDITVSAAKNVAGIVREHENGHVLICKNIYAKAESAAEKSAASVVGLKFTGEGIDQKSAQEAAIDQAAEQVCRLYRLSTNENANRVSALYDRLSVNGAPKSVSDRVKTAEAEIAAADKAVPQSR